LSSVVAKVAEVESLRGWLLDPENDLLHPGTAMYERIPTMAELVQFLALQKAKFKRESLPASHLFPLRFLFSFVLS